MADDTVVAIADQLFFQCWWCWWSGLEGTFAAARFFIANRSVCSSVRVFLTDSVSWRFAIVYRLSGVGGFTHDQTKPRFGFD